MKNNLVSSAQVSPSRPQTLSDQLAMMAERHPDKLFVGIDDGSLLTYRQARLQSEAYAAGLARAGVKKGDRVALVMGNRMDFVVAFFAILRLGAIVTPINIYLRGEFLAYQLQDSDASVVIGDASGVAAVKSLAAKLPDLRQIYSTDDSPADDGLVSAFKSLNRPDEGLPLVPLEESDIAAILYTSGTTSLPKGCMLSHRYYLSFHRQFFANGMVVPGDVIATPFPLYHASGNLITLTVALCGCVTVHYTREFSASQFIDQAAASAATVLWGVGPMGAAILASPAKPSDRQHKIRLAMWVPMRAERQVEFEKRFGVTVHSESYGQTEISPITLSPPDQDRVRGSLGRPATSVELRLVDEHDRDVPPGSVGEIVIRPREPYVMFSGYWRKPEETVKALRNLWHHTGDAATMDEKGNLYFVDRKNDRIRRRGVNVSSVELEHAILGHPDVAQVAVHAVPAPLGEDDIKACIVPVAGVRFTAEVLFDFFKRELPYYAVPRYVEILERLPTNALGRIMKHELRKSGASTWDFEALGLAIAKADRRA